MSIEEREDHLGSLPEDRLEQQVLSPGEAGAPMPGQGIPVDIARQQGVKGLTTARDQLMSQGSSVRSVYDSRPINATDFLHTFANDLELTDPGETETISFDYFIPGGYIGVLRGFHYEFELAVATVERTGILCSILVNDIVQVGYEDMTLGQITVDPQLQPTFILVPLSGKLTLKLVFDGTPYVDGGVPIQSFFVKLYGNLLLTQGVPLPFEIGNLGPIKPLT